jgi:hypothetical protein
MQQRVAALRGPVIATVLCVILPTTVGSQPVTLDDLFGGETLLVGDKLFSDFELVENRSRAASDPLTTTVDGFVSGTGLVGLRFNGVVNDSLVATGNELIDFTFRFKVRSLDDLAPIKDVGLDLTIFDPHDILDVSEFVFEEGGNPLFDSFGFNAVNPQQTSDETEFAPRETIEVQKSIVLGGGFKFDEEGDPVLDEEGNLVGATSSITTMEQTFSQVPEPGTLGLLTLGGLAALGVRRHRPRPRTRPPQTPFLDSGGTAAR